MLLDNPIVRTFLRFLPGTEVIGASGSFTGSLSGSEVLVQNVQTVTATAGTLNVTSSLTASGLTYPTVDGPFGVEVIKTDGIGNLELEIPKTVYEYVKNVSGGTLLKGTPVHSVGTSGFQVEVIAADASNPTTMPATLILAQDLADEGEGLGIAIGAIQGVDTTGLEAGNPVYVGVGGGWTQTKPTGSALIQNLGIVTKVGANGGGIVLGAGRSNDVPNIQPGHFWLGNENWVPTPFSTSSFATTGSNTFVGDQIISGSVDIKEDLTVTGSAILPNIVYVPTVTTIYNGDTTTIRTINAGASDAAFLDYSIRTNSGVNKRAGNAIIMWDISSPGYVEYTEYSSLDLGDTSQMQISASIDSTTVTVSVINTTGETVNIKHLVREF